MTVKDLLSVLYGCGYDKAQAASFVRRALNDRLNGRVVYKNAPRKKMTQKDAVLYLKKNLKKNFGRERKQGIYYILGGWGCLS